MRWMIKLSKSLAVRSSYLQHKRPNMLEKNKSITGRAQRECNAGDSALLKDELKRSRAVTLAEVLANHVESKWPSNAKK
jgi:hypothetical protein